MVNVITFKLFRSTSQALPTVPPAPFPDITTFLSAVRTKLAAVELENVSCVTEAS